MRVPLQLILSILLIQNHGSLLFAAKATHSKTENGVKYEYTNDKGLETLRVKGILAPDFDAEGMMSDFRSVLNLDKRKTCAGPKTEEEERPSKTLLESFSDYFVGTNFAVNVQKYYEAYTHNEQQEQVDLAKRELIIAEDDLTKVQTQQLILSRRQSELGVWIKENINKPPEERNPTVEELVNVESDRLALLEHRLVRLENKLRKQRAEIDGYLKMRGRANERQMYQKVDEETHIFTRKTEEECHTPTSSAQQHVIPASGDVI